MNTSFLKFQILFIHSPSYNITYQNYQWLNKMFFQLFTKPDFGFVDSLYCLFVCLFVLAALCSLQIQESQSTRIKPGTLQWKVDSKTTGLTENSLSVVSLFSMSLFYSIIYLLLSLDFQLLFF